jgi:hypothetical protein
MHLRKSVEECDLSNNKNSNFMQNKGIQQTKRAQIHPTRHNVVKKLDEFMIIWQKKPEL